MKQLQGGKDLEMLAVSSLVIPTKYRGADRVGNGFACVIFHMWKSPSEKKNSSTTMWLSTNFSVILLISNLVHIILGHRILVFNRQLTIACIYHIQCVVL